MAAKKSVKVVAPEQEEPSSSEISSATSSEESSLDSDMDTEELEELEA